MKINYLVLLFVTIVTIGCATNRSIKKVSTKSDLVNFEWQIVEISDVLIKEKINGKLPYLLLDKSSNHYSIITGCNTLNGEFTTTKNSIEFKGGMSTMMYCDDMSVEDGFKTVLSSIKTYAIDGNTLYLKDGDKVLVKLKRKNGDSITDLKGTSWELDLLSSPGVDFNSLFAGKKPTLTFMEELKVSGNASCNNFNASYSLDGTGIKFGPIMSTKMMCPNIKAEDVFLGALGKINTYSVSGDVLTLITGDIAVMRFKKI